MCDNNDRREKKLFLFKDVGKGKKNHFFYLVKNFNL